jgi:nucleoside-diphosphate-sugar epimerase
MRVFGEVKPTHVIHELTALPKAGARRASDLEPTNRLRIEGTRYLLEAAVAVGARRFVVGSFAPLSNLPPDTTDAAAIAIRSMESQVLEANQSRSIEGVVLRYGLFYGPHNPATDSMIDLVRRRRLPVVKHDAGRLPVIHLDDAVSATVLALTRGRPGGVFEIVDDHPVSMSEIVTTIAELTHSARPIAVPRWLPKIVAPYMARLTSMQLDLSNARARVELGWQPRFATSRQGLTDMLAHAA